MSEEQSLWLFRDFIGSGEVDEILKRVVEKGRVERWGHAARIPLWAGPDEVVLVVEGDVEVKRADGNNKVRLRRGDAFGRTDNGRIREDLEGGDELVARGETTICSVPEEALREIWEEDEFRRSVEAGRWFSKELVEVPVWPLLGTLPTTRLARILLHLVENYGEIKGSKGKLPITLRQSQLAELAGVGKSRAGEVWQLFERTGLVAVESGSVILKNLKQLREMAV